MLKPYFLSPALLFALSPQQPAPAPALVIPAQDARMVNPVKSTPESLAHARKIYTYD